MFCKLDRLWFWYSMRLVDESRDRLTLDFYGCALELFIFIFSCYIRRGSLLLPVTLIVTLLGVRLTLSNLLSLPCRMSNMWWIRFSFRLSVSKMSGSMVWYFLSAIPINLPLFYYQKCHCNFSYNIGSGCTNLYKIKLKRNWFEGKPRIYWSALGPWSNLRSFCDFIWTILAILVFSQGSW